jgi:hypothetical protein
LVKGLIASLDGARVVSHEMAGPLDQAHTLGLDLGKALLAMGAGEILAEITRG